MAKDRTRELRRHLSAQHKAGKKGGKRKQLAADTYLARELAGQVGCY